MQYVIAYVGVSIIFASILSLLLYFSPVAQQDKDGFHVIEEKRN